MTDNLILIAAIDAENGARQKEGEPLEVRARAAMEAVQHHWMVTDREKQFAAACEGLARTCDEEELERVKDDLHKLQRASSLINALVAGVPVDWEALSEETERVEDEAEPLGLRKMWEAIER